MKTRELIRDIVQDIAILDGTNVGPSGSSWQDVASTLASNLARLAGSLYDMRTGDRPIDLPDLDMIVDSIEYQRGGDRVQCDGETSILRGNDECCAYCGELLDALNDDDDRCDDCARCAGEES